MGRARVEYEPFTPAEERRIVGFYRAGNSITATSRRYTSEILIRWRRDHPSCIREILIRHGVDSAIGFATYPQRCVSWARMSDAVIALALIFLGVFLLVVASADMLVARTDEVTALRLDEGVQPLPTR
jgi:hypothetical protein